MTSNIIPKREILIVSRGTHLGFEWVTTFNKEIEYWYGYINIPANHHWYSLPLCEIDEVIEVHSGLTFGGTRHFDEDDLNGYWIGFDCGHAFDMVNLVDQEHVEIQCRSMCGQANAVLPCIDVEVVSNYEILISEGQI